MNKFIGVLIVTVFGISFFSSCDKVEPPYTVENNNSNTNDTVRKVLLEDFTGHTCVNCPTAHDAATDLHKVYGNQLITVAIHAGYFSNPKSAPFDYDFRTTAGNDYESQFSLSATPIGMVNRIKYGNSYLLTYGDWASKVSQQIDSLSEEPDLYIHIAPTYNSSSNSVDINTEVTFLKNMPSGKYNLTVYIIEDSIIKPQKDNREPDGEILDYVHNHVLRAAVNGSWGSQVVDGNPSVNDKFTDSFTYSLGSDWVADNCKIVAYVYFADGSNEYQIIQAQEVKLK